MFKKKLENTNGDALIKQLYWRDFYYNIMYNYPESLNESLKEKY